MKLKHHPLSTLGSRLRATLPILAAVLGLAGISAAALPDPGKLLSCTLSDKVTQTVVAGQIVTAGTTSISISMALGDYFGDVSPIDLSELTDATTIKLQIGGYSYDGTLADDPNIAVNLNKRSVFIPANVNPTTNKPIGSNGLKVVWTSTKVTFTVLRAQGDITDFGSPLAKSLLQIAQTTGSTSPIIDQFPITLEFGEFKGGGQFYNDMDELEIVKRSCYIKGTRVVAAKVVSGQTYNLNTITLTGVIDTVIPTLTVTVPNGGVTDMSGAITLTGKVTDGYDIDYTGASFFIQDGGYTFYIKTDPVATITQTLKGPPQGALLSWWGAIEKNWSLSFADLPYGRNTDLGITVEDKSGNAKNMNVVLTRKLPPQLVGRWDALLNDSNSDSRGYLTFNVTDTGVISGSYRLNETSAATSFTGAWSGAGFNLYLPKTDVTISGEISSPETLSAQTEVQLQMPISLNSFDINGGYSAAGVAYRAPFTSKNILPAASPLLGTFNGKLGGSVGGNGHFSIVTSNAGLNTISGKLSDGTSFTASSAVGAIGQVSFFTNLYSNKGYLMAQQLRTNGAFVDDVSPSVDWVRPASFTDKQFPAGFILGLTTQIRRYTVPAANTRVLGLTTPNLVASWSGDGVTGTATRNLLLSTANAVTLNGVGTAFTSTIATKTGLVTGTFALPTVPASTAAYSALIVGDAITGHYIAPAPTGAVQKRYGSFSMGPPAQ